MPTEATKQLLQEEEERAVARFQRDLEELEVHQQLRYPYRTELKRGLARERAQKAARRLGFTIEFTEDQAYDETENRIFYLLGVTLLRRPERDVSPANRPASNLLPATVLGSDEQYDCDQTVFHLSATTYIWLPRWKFIEGTGVLLPNGHLRDDWDFGHGVITLMGTSEAIWSLNIARQKSVLNSVRVGNGITHVSWALKEGAAPAQENDGGRNTGAGRRQQPDTGDELSQSL
jgi:hypothetical protein